MKTLVSEMAAECCLCTVVLLSTHTCDGGGWFAVLTGGISPQRLVSLGPYSGYRMSEHLGRADSVHRVLSDTLHVLTAMLGHQGVRPCAAVLPVLPQSPNETPNGCLEETLLMLLSRCFLCQFWTLTPSLDMVVKVAGTSLRSGHDEAKQR